MKILIAYSTKSGTTAKCADMLANMLPAHKVTLADLSKTMPDVAEYDFVAVGSPVRMGNLHKKTAEFLEVHKEELMAVRAGYFISCGFVDSTDEYIKKLIPQQLRESAVVCSGFGGELNVKKIKGFDKLIVKLIIKFVFENKTDGELPSKSLPEISSDNISRFADAIKASFGRH